MPSKDRSFLGLLFMPIGLITLRLPRKLLLYYDVHLNGFHQGRQWFHEGKESFFQSLNQPMDYQCSIWHLKYQAKVYRDLVKRIPFFYGYGNPLFKKNYLAHVNFYLNLHPIFIPI